MLIPSCSLVAAIDILNIFSHSRSLRPALRCTLWSLQPSGLPCRHKTQSKSKPKVLLLMGVEYFSIHLIFTAAFPSPWITRQAFQIAHQPSDHAKKGRETCMNHVVGPCAMHGLLVLSWSIVDRIARSAWATHPCWPVCPCWLARACVLALGLPCLGRISRGPAHACGPCLAAGLCATSSDLFLGSSHRALRTGLLYI